MTNSTEMWDIVPWYSGLPSAESGKRLSLALQIYIDDSGKNDPPVFVLASFVASDVTPNLHPAAIGVSAS